jgi:hypothetical protein
MPILFKLLSVRPMPQFIVAMVLLWLTRDAVDQFGGPLWASLALQIVLGSVMMVFGVMLCRRGLAEMKQARKS